ncbi:MAG: hypothetical protein WBQ29_00740 [Isosphaeraceae bacterium]
MNSRSAQAPSQRQSPGFSKQAVRPSRVFHGLDESVWQTSPVNVRTLLIAGLLYLACLLVAVLPYPLGFARNLPSAGDSSQHLWIVRWYKTCLLEGKNPLYCNELQAPVGVPLTYFTPLLLQSLLYMPLSFICANDVIIYHILWVTGLVTTGLGTFVLASLVTRDRRAAWLGGLLAMLSGPMMMHAHGHLEMIYLGGFPLFLAAWIGFVDHPSRARLGAAVALYLFLVAGAAYYFVLGLVSPVAFVVWRLASAKEHLHWLRARLPWFVAYALLLSVCLIPLFAAQIWGVVHGYAMTRSRLEFEHFAAPWWSYFVPTNQHRLARLLPMDLFERLSRATVGDKESISVVEGGSYLGSVTLVLMIIALAKRRTYPRASFWWLALATLIVLSLGAYLRLGGRSFSMPALWMWRNVPLFRLIRVPARFNLLAAVVAAVLAAAGAGQVLAWLRKPWAGTATIAALASVAMLDMGIAPEGWELKPLPAAYRALDSHDPDSALIELPLANSVNDCIPLDRTYWQALHRRPTSVGYGSLANFRFHELVLQPSAFPIGRRGFLEDPSRERFGVVHDVRFLDYAWLYLSVNRFRYVLLHHQGGSGVADPDSLARLRLAFEKARIFEDAETAVYDRNLLEPPRAPILLVHEGFRCREKGQPDRPDLTGVARVGTIAIYNPDSDKELIVTLRARALNQARSVRLLTGDRELAYWQVEPSESREYRSPPFRCPPGLGWLTLQSEAEESPARYEDALDEKKSPYSFQISRLSLEFSSSRVARPPTEGGEERGENRRMR